MLLRRSIRSFALLFCTLQLVVAAEKPAAHVRNFDKVNDQIYRGGDPTAVGLTELGAMGVKIDLDLRETGEATKTEQDEAEKLGIKYVNIPMKPFSAPTEDQMQRALALLRETKSAPIFVHCRRGKDRTGAVIACYRIQHDGWSNEQALDEARKHGMSFTERAMQSYVLHFKPVAIAETSAPLK
jgi:tyrosine-protein phosphatase SIW14